MTLPTSTRVTDPYETDGVQRDFEFDFPAFYNADTGHYGIEVRRLTALEYEVIDKSLYDIFLNDEDKSGYVRFHVAPVAGDDIYIAGDTTRSQQLNLINYGRYSAQSIEKAFDLIVALIQEFVSKVDEETRQRILSDQALRDFLLIKFNQFAAEVTAKIDKHVGDVNGFISSLIPMFVCIMRKEIAHYAETGMQDVIDEKLSGLSTQVANAIAENDAALIRLNESILKIEAITTATAIAARFFDTPAAGVDPVTGVPVGSYFNVRSPNADAYVDEYQNVGGSAVATGKSYPSSYAVESAINNTNDLIDIAINAVQVARFNIENEPEEPKIENGQQQVNHVDFDNLKKEVVAKDRELAVMTAWRSKSAEEVVKASGATGVLNVRNYANDSGFEATKRPFDTSYATLSMHSHQNFFNTLGMGEFSAVLNGLYVRTTHNDPFLTYSVKGSVSVDGSAGAATKEIDYVGAAMPPALPASVLARPTGVVFNDTTTQYGFTELSETVGSNNTQVEYFRNIFNNQDYLKDCRWDLLYLEVYVEELGADGAIVSNVTSPRHFSQGSTVRDAIYRNAMTSNSGFKSTLENDSFQSGVIEYVNRDGSAAQACITYRLRTRSVGKPTVAPLTFNNTDNKPPLILIGEAVGALGTHPHKLDGKTYTIGGVAYQAIQLTPSQANTIVSGTPVVIKTSVDQSHAHELEVSYSNGVWQAKDIYVVNISGSKVEGHVHSTQVVSQSENIPFDLYKAVNGIVDNTNKFKLIRDTNQRDSLGQDATWLDLAVSNKARFVLAENILDTICERCYGLDGEGSYSIETFALPDTAPYQVLSPYDSQVLNVSKYNKSYAIGGLDASNRGSSPRGFNDPTLYVAKDNTGKSITGYSYMIPIELVLRTPYETWNPYEIFVYRAKAPDKSEASYLLAQKSAPNTMASYFGGYYVSPIGVFGKSQTSSDGADTGSSTVWMVSGEEQTVKVEATGISITKVANKEVGSFVYKTPQGDDYSNVLRFRYPIYANYFDQTYDGIKSKAFNVRLKQLLLKVIDGTAEVGDVNEIIGDF